LKFSAPLTTEDIEEEESMRDRNGMVQEGVGLWYMGVGGRL